MSRASSVVEWEHGEALRMSATRIAMVAGSLRRESFNRQLANAVKKLAPAELQFHDLKIDDLPRLENLLRRIRP